MNKNQEDAVGSLQTNFKMLIISRYIPYNFALIGLLNFERLSYTDRALESQLERKNVKISSFSHSKTTLQFIKMFIYFKLKNISTRQYNNTCP